MRAYLDIYRRLELLKRAFGIIEWLEGYEDAAVKSKGKELRQLLVQILSRSETYE